MQKNWDKCNSTNDIFKKLFRVSEKSNYLWGKVTISLARFKGTLLDCGIKQHGLTMSDCELAYSFV